MAPENPDRYLIADESSHLRNGRAAISKLYLPSFSPKFASVVSLKDSKLFQNLSPDEAQSFSASVEERSFSAGDRIFQEGEQGDGLYIVREGLVEISGVLNHANHRVFSLAAAGDMFGEMAVLEDKPRSASATASGPVSTFFIRREEMQKLIQRFPALAVAILKEVSNRLREFNRQYLEETLQSERLSVIGRFSRSIVHDLKNPLNIIGLSAELARMPNISVEARETSCTRIIKQVERISDMIGEILDFTQGSNVKFILAPIDYGEFVAQLVTELQPEVALRSASLQVALPLPSVKLLINPKRLKRVFYNLLHNATDAMAEGGEIHLRLRETPVEIITEIEDSGAGIPSEISQQLFEAFVSHGKEHGTGLGLSICKRIVEDHGGWIKARNAENGGALFSFGLPRPKQGTS